MVKRAELDRSAAIKMVAQLAKSTGDRGLAEMATEIHARLRKPMIEILKKVPGKTVQAKADRCGVTRQCWYDWVKGAYRPTGEQSRRLAKLTGIPLAYIEGKGEKPPKRKKKEPSVAETAA